MNQSTKASILLDEEEDLWRPPKVAGVLGVSLNTLAIWRCRREGPTFLKVGRQIRYRPEDVEEFKDACERRCDPVIGSHRRGRR